MIRYAFYVELTKYDNHKAPDSKRLKYIIINSINRLVLVFLLQIQIRHKTTANVSASSKNVSYSSTSSAYESCSINLNCNPQTNGPKNRAPN